MEQSLENHRGYSEVSLAGELASAPRAAGGEEQLREGTKPVTIFDEVRHRLMILGKHPTFICSRGSTYLGLMELTK